MIKQVANKIFCALKAEHCRSKDNVTTDKEFIKTIETGCIKPFLETFYQVMGHKTHKAERYTSTQSSVYLELYSYFQATKVPLKTLKYSVYT